LKNIKLLSLGLILGSHLAVPVNTQAEELRLGVVSFSKVYKEMEGSPQEEVARKALDREFSPRKRDIDATQERIKRLEDRLVKEGATLSDSELRRLRKEIDSNKRDLRRDQEEFRDDYNLRYNEEVGKIHKQILKVIQAVAKEGNYDIVVSEGVLYVSDKVDDITDKVVKRLKAGK
jgi:outer membrane protein